MSAGNTFAEQSTSNVAILTPFGGGDQVAVSQILPAGEGIISIPVNTVNSTTSPVSDGLGK